MKKSTKYMLWGFGLTAGTIAAVVAFNRIVQNMAVSNDYLAVADSHYYEYTHGKIYYRKSGSGAPILLINNIYSGFGTGYEFSKLEKILAEDHTVYTMDLLGTGKSDKPALLYTNFMFAQMINSFITDVIGKPTEVVTSGETSSFAVIAAIMNESLFKSLVMLNPEDIEKTGEYTSTIDKMRYILEVSPVIGTFLYTVCHTNQALKLKLALDGYDDKDKLYTYDYKSFLKAAFLKHGNGKYLQAAMHANYTHLNIEHALSKLTIPMKVIATDDFNSSVIAQRYQNTNDNIKTLYIPNVKQMAALESPTDVYHAIYD